MKKFNQTISVQVEVDTIAQMLLSSMDKTFKHSESVVEAIIGSAVEAGNVGYVYNALAGFTNEIDFKAGDKVICTETVYQYVNTGTVEAPKYERKDLPIGECVVEEVNIFKRDKLTVRFNCLNSAGVLSDDSRNVRHNTCTQTS